MTTWAVRSVFRPHRPEAGFESAVVAFDPVVGVLGGVVKRVGQQLCGDVWERVGQVGDDLVGLFVRVERCGEAAGGGDVAFGGEVHVDDLAVVVHCPVHVLPGPGELHVGLVVEPAAAGRVTARSGRVAEHGRDALYPPVQGDVIDLDAALDEQLLEVSVGPRVPQVPAHRQQGHLGREPEPGERW